MEKFLWNTLGVVLIFANFLSLIMFLVTSSNVWAAICLVLIGLGWLYKEKCPTFIEV